MTPPPPSLFLIRPSPATLLSSLPHSPSPSTPPSPFSPFSAATTFAATLSSHQGRDYFASKKDESFV
ncbi:hypothetical protein TIFTF001_021980 [Ficus carica]|uniref:Uncharacterized protein n=1 Tax=Ficus carica TaxID=3494 RepID=A0AA88DE40_FICCA|nr:hypothetical protein TIFTF001_021980 [Ficus carica]